SAKRRFSWPGAGIAKGMAENTPGTFTADSPTEKQRVVSERNIPPAYAEYTCNLAYQKKLR
ncbi:hypothetical protein OCJ35_09260, partial [Pluralibacter gergoviae]|uniref:hypothetical protein n=1 Tax=Pluralibacter gergoviae TaxID=61647 RepID=UPI0021F45700